MAATTLRAPDPSLLDTVPAGDPLNGRHHAALADEAGSLKEHDEEERHCKRFGPITLDTTDMQLLFKARQVSPDWLTFPGAPRQALRGPNH